MKKLVCLFASLCLLCPCALAAGDSAHASAAVPAWLCAPFAALLLCVALGPVLAAHWWEKHQGIVVAVLSVVLLAAFAMVQSGSAAAELALECLVND